MLKEFEEFSGFHYSIQQVIKRAEILEICTSLKFINNLESTKSQEPGFLYTALDRFSNSFRGRQNTQSIVDLIVALESMLGFDARGLKRRLATNAAFLLGTNEGIRRIIYDHVSAGYDLRSEIVHGSMKKEQEKAICKALEKFFPELKGKQTNKVLPYIDKATEELQRILRLILKAYVYMRQNHTRAHWPSTDDFENLFLDSAKRRLIQKQLGITAKQPAPPSWHY